MKTEKVDKLNTPSVMPSKRTRNRAPVISNTNPVPAVIQFSDGRSMMSPRLEPRKKKSTTRMNQTYERLSLTKEMSSFITRCKDPYSEQYSQSNEKR